MVPQLVTDIIPGFVIKSLQPLLVEVNVGTTSSLSSTLLLTGMDGMTENELTACASMYPGKLRDS